MPPEILSGQDLRSSSAIDVWALGILTYQLFTGTLPFNSEKPSQIRDNIINSEIKFPDDISINPLAKELIIKMLEKNKDKRIKIFELMDNEWLFPGYSDSDSDNI